MKNTVKVDHSQLAATLGSLPEEHLELVYALILCHYEEVNQGTKFHSEPFGGTVFEGGRGISFNSKKIPPVLVNIIHAYLELCPKA